jgi:hypothetical protein
VLALSGGLRNFLQSYFRLHLRCHSVGPLQDRQGTVAQQVLRKFWPTLLLPSKDNKARVTLTRSSVRVNVFGSK